MAWLSRAVATNHRLTRRPALWLLVTAALLFALDRVFPLPAAARGDAPGVLVVLAQDGTPLRSWAGADGSLRHPITPDDVSPHYLQALLQYEDRWFDWHPGVNPVALVRAAWQWAWHGRIVSGGSTLTMQVARILDASLDDAGAAPRSVATKLRQIGRALQLEAHLSKREILTLYLNHAPMGGQVQGVEMASRAYLGKAARELSPAEAALLVALPQTPSRLRPDRAPGAAQAARDKVLARMVALGVWDAATVADAKLERVFAPPLRARWLAPLAAERLRQEALAGVRGGPRADAASHRLRAAASAPPSARSSAAPTTGASAPPSTIRSTLDAGVQTRLEQVLLDRLAGLPEHVSIAALVVDNTDLAVRGYAGSADFTDNARAPHVDMVRAVRSPGSTLKPFLYAMALDDGLVHSESLLIDAPQNFGGYAPGNFESAFSGPVSLSDALQRSLNVPAVDLLDRIGPARFAAQLRNAGVKLRIAEGGAPNLSLILGGGGTTLEELVGAYAALARGGVAGVVRLTPDAPRVETRLMSPGAAFIVREILENGGRPDAPFREGANRVAWKTGTSFGFRDAWAVGVTDRYTVGVWVGRPDGTPNPGHFGANTSAPLVKDLLTALGNTTLRPRSVPANVRAIDICWPLGLAAASTAPEHCRVRRAAWVLDGTAPPTLPDRVNSASLLTTAWVDTGTSQRLRPGCAAGAGAMVAALPYARWPTLLEPWIPGEWRSHPERIAFAPPCATHDLSRSLRITGIEQGSIIRATPEQRSAVVRVQAIGARDAVTWLLDGRLIGSTDLRSPGLKLTLDCAGDHALTALDADGRYERVVFSVH